MAYEYLLQHSWKETQGRYFPYAMKEKLKAALYLGLGEKRIRAIKRLIGKKA